MAKRRADTELNHDNWNQDLSDEEAGTFKKATDAALAKRKISVGRRRSDVVTTGGPASSAVFKQFAGFGAVGAEGTPGKPSFNFGGAFGGGAASNSPASSSASAGSGANKSAAGLFSFGGGSPKLPEKTPENPQKKMFEATSFKMSADSPFASSPSTSQHNKENSKPSVFGGNSSSNGLDSNKTVEPENKSSEKEVHNAAYLSSLKALNEGVLKHMKKHLDDNVFINLNPVFNDYKKHFDELERRYKPKFVSNKSSEESTKTVTASVSAETPSISSVSQPKSPEVSVKSPPSTPAFSFGTKTSSPAAASPQAPSKPVESKSPVESASAKLLTAKPQEPAVKSSFPTGEASKFSFGKTDGDSKSSKLTFGGAGSSDSNSSGFSFGGGQSSFSFGAKDTEGKAAFSFGAKDSGSSGFSFGGASGSSGFSFGAGTLGAKPAESSSSQSGEAAEDAPPKLEVVEHQEEGSVYDKRCKLFYKKDGAFVDKGVGTLFLKPVPDSQKTQLLVRAGTSLGNILLNIVLSEKMPTQRTGKNNVVIICIPNPPIDPKTPSGPTTMLIRVKTAEDADELFAKINEFREKNK